MLRIHATIKSSTEVGNINKTRESLRVDCGPHREATTTTTRFDTQSLIYLITWVRGDEWLLTASFQFEAIKGRRNSAMI